jgi:hypothetical protein
MGQLNYGHAATLRRINLGGCGDKNRYGFVLDIERGYWQRNDLMPDKF